MLAIDNHFIVQSRLWPSRMVRRYYQLWCGWNNSRFNRWGTYEEYSCPGIYMRSNLISVCVSH